MINSVRALTAASYMSMFFLGIAGAIVGAAARSIDLTAEQIGLFLAVQNIGFMIAVIVAGALSDTYEKPRILFVGSLVLAAAFFSFYATDIFWVNVLVMLFIGLGTGTYEGATDAMLLEIHEQRQSLHININHFFVTFGSILITVYLIFLALDWRISMLQSAGVVLLLALIYAFARAKNSGTQGDTLMRRLSVLSRERLVVVLLIGTIAAVGAEIGTTGIMTTYLAESRGFTETTSRIGLIVFLSGIAAGRILIGFVSQREQFERFIVALFGFASIVFVVLFAIDLGQFSYLSAFIAGVSISALLPLMITYAGQQYPLMAGTVIGTIKVAIPVGGILLPFLLSALSASMSLQVALWIFPAALFLAFTLLLLQFRQKATTATPPA